MSRAVSCTAKTSGCYQTPVHRRERGGVALVHRRVCHTYPMMDGAKGPMTQGINASNLRLCRERSRLTVGAVPQLTSGSKSRVLAKEGDFQYMVATPEFSDRMVRILSDSFAREPMSAAMDFSPEDLVPFFARFMPECTTNGLSVLATPVERPETLAGVFMCGDFKSPFPERLLEEIPRFAPIAHALETVDRAYELQRPGLAPGDAVDLFTVAVTPGSQFARKGIASALFRVCADLARDRGFKRCVTECTGHYSQTAVRKAGFQERARLAYRDFLFEGRSVFAKIEPPHTHLILFERES
jgi:hypothetical protein